MAKINNKFDEELRRRNKDSFENAALYWNNLANQRLFEISKQLLGIAFILLPLTGSIVLSDKSINLNSIHLLVIGWIALFISIICGFYSLWDEAKYFNYLSNDSSTRQKIWRDSNRLVGEMNEDTNKLGPVKSNSSFGPLIMQGLFLLIGVIFIMIVVFNLLLQNNHQTSHYEPWERFTKWHHYTY